MNKLEGRGRCIGMRRIGTSGVFSKLASFTKSGSTYFFNYEIIQGTFFAYTEN